eukprot:CAMPEP_0168344884 /NCGR_PEP_ID=MMETSP0213-20121227/17146_1 /TAXON_ID=151035 /ORGANISM="Euplotes harpa, Strain FSP1.4" /LENGTH=121 /DNA_ID=CAMNT_0008352839 /DNA_START=132 /DNA_END=497 /DNA_ORIENTATION=-
MKLNNVETDNHQINEEIGRLSKLFIKIDKVLDPKKYEAKPKPKNAVPKRIISSAISANNFIKKKEDKSKRRAKQKAKDRELKSQEQNEEAKEETNTIEVLKAPSKPKHNISSADFMDDDSD